MTQWLDDQNYINILTKLTDSDLVFCSRFKQCENFDRGFYGFYDKQWIFAKLAKAENDNSLCCEYENGLKINKLRKEIPNFIYTYTLTRVKQCHFPTGVYKFPRDVLFTEYINDKLLFNYRYGKSFELLLSIFQQITVVLDYSFKKIGFIHGDCNTSNIVIKKCKTPISIKYDDLTIHVDLLCVLYDFGKSTFLDNRNTESKSDLINDLLDLCKFLFKKNFKDEMDTLVQYLIVYNDINQFLDLCGTKWNVDIRVGNNKQINMLYFNSFTNNKNYNLNEEHCSDENINIDISYINNRVVTENQRPTIRSTKYIKKDSSTKVADKSCLIKDKNYIPPVAPWINAPKVEAVSIRDLNKSPLCGKNDYKIII